MNAGCSSAAAFAAAPRSPVTISNRCASIVASILIAFGPTAS
jgi:hypothetical protein